MKYKKRQEKRNPTWKNIEIVMESIKKGDSFIYASCDDKKNIHITMVLYDSHADYYLTKFLKEYLEQDVSMKRAKEVKAFYEEKYAIADHLARHGE